MSRRSQRAAARTASSTPPMRAGFRLHANGATPSSAAGSVIAASRLTCSAIPAGQGAGVGVRVAVALPVEDRDAADGAERAPGRLRPRRVDVDLERDVRPARGL